MNEEQIRVSGERKASFDMTISINTIANIITAVCAILITFKIY